jgi:DNA replication protein DnaC
MDVDKLFLTQLIEASMAADYTAVRRLGNQIAKRLAEEKDLDGAKAMQNLLRKRGAPLQASGYMEAIPRDAASRLPLVEEAAWPATPLFLDSGGQAALSHFLEDATNIQLLSESGVSSRLGLLLYGPPGTGKSLLAGHIAAKLQRPFYIARLDSLISSRLGETSKNIRGVFEFIPTRQAVLFLDEMDAVAKLRDDRHELGELKRVVNTVLQGLDSLTDDVIVIGATNHQHLLDPAIWRRFPYKLELTQPDEAVRQALWSHFLFQDRGEDEKNAQLLAKVSAGASGAEIETIALAARRRAVISGQMPSLAHIVMAAGDAAPGNARLPDNRELSTLERKGVARTLDAAGISAAEIGRVLGISRQMVYRYRSGTTDE